MMIKEIYNVRYIMAPGCCFDIWRLSSGSSTSVMYHSTPVSFDEDKDILMTASGSVYHISSYGDVKSKVVEQIKSDIANMGFEVH